MKKPMSDIENELEALRAEFSAWLSANMPPKPDFMVPESFMEVGTEQQLEWLRAWQNKVYEAGYLGMSWPTEYGGQGNTDAHQKVIDYELSRQQAPIIFNTVALSWTGPLILEVGSEADKQRYLKRMLTAEDIWCQGFSEPDAGGDLAGIKCSARRDGDDWIINGSKIWTTHGAFADHIILLARTSPPDSNNRYSGMSFFLAPMKIDGVTPQPIEKLTHEHGFTQTFFDDARIPGSSLIGGEGNGWQIAMLTLTYERSVKGGQGGHHALTPMPAEFLVAMAAEVERDGGPALADPQVRTQLVQFLIEERGFQLSISRATVPALVAERPHSLGLSHKWRLSELRRRIGQFGTLLQGPEGALFMGDDEARDDGQWPRSYMNAFSSTIGGGTSQIQHNIVAERVLGLPKD
jgi:alkylation response protein AidB-like acyl-CoA dehydrogenase